MCKGQGSCWHSYLGRGSALVCYRPIFYSGVPSTDLRRDLIEGLRGLLEGPVGLLVREPRLVPVLAVAPILATLRAAAHAPPPRTRRPRSVGAHEDRDAARGVRLGVMFFRLRALGRRSSGSVAPFVCAVVVVVVVVLVGLLVVWFVKSIPSLGIEPKTTRLKV